jgi:predicted TPR repeat methyltransferase
VLGLKIESTDDIEDLLLMFIASAAFGTALDLGLFWRLAEEPLGAEGVSKAYNIPFKRCRSWLELLMGLGLLKRQGETYIPSSIAQTAIIKVYSPEVWALYAQDTRERYLAGNNLTDLISNPESVWTVQGMEPPNYVAEMVENPERARRFSQMLYEIHGPLADKLAQTIDMVGVRRLMDLGGGSGVVSLALLRHHPDLTAVVVDIENVCHAGREIAAKTPMTNRITYHPANFLQDPLPTGFDIILECDVGIYTEELFHKLHTSLNARGRLVIVDWFIQSDRQQWIWRLSHDFISSLGTFEATNQTSEEVQKLLVQVGFHDISAKTLENNRAVIQAHK